MIRRLIRRQTPTTLTAIGSTLLLVGCPPVLRSDLAPATLDPTAEITDAIPGLTSATDRQISGNQKSDLHTSDRQVSNPINGDHVLPSGSSSIEVSICADLPDWHRPESVEQTKQLEAMPRYGSAIHQDPLASLVKDWWSHQVFSFTTYGLSARVDPLYMSGVWTAIDQLATCYETDQPEQINAEMLAEIWLLGHDLIGLEWADDHYLMTIQPAPTGLQVLQFNRVENSPNLPMQVITPAGNPIAIMSGDW